MKKLIAKRPILYRSKQYEIGYQLPADNETMVDAWLEAESAEWVDEATDAHEKEEKPEAKEQKAKTTAKKATTKKGE